MIIFRTIKLLMIFFAILTQITLCASIHEQSIENVKIEGEHQAPVVIVGGGLTGLITAYELNKADISCVLLEANDRVGGRVETIYYPDGSVAEAHMEEYWEDTPNVTFLKELNLPLIEAHAGFSMIINKKIYALTEYANADYFKHLFNAEEYASLKKWNDKTWKLYQTLKETKAQNKKLSSELAKLLHISFADYVKSERLPEKVNQWIRISLEPEISVKWNQICALDGIDEMSIFLINPSTDKILKNFHVEGGNENYTQALVKASTKTHILKNSKVTHISQKNDRVELIFQDAAGKSHKIISNYAVVTVPLFAIKSIDFNPPLNRDYQKAIDSTRFASYIKIQYRVKPEIEKVWEKYKTDSLFTLITDTPIGCLYDSTGLQKDLNKDRDWVITSLVYGETAKEWCKFSSDKMIEKANEEIEKIFPGFASYVVSFQVYMYPTAIAYWPVGLRSRFDHLAKVLRRPFGRIQIGGDTTECSHSAGAAEAAIRMSKQIIEWTNHS